ncbi:MAG TPA: BatD family protein [Chthoniobacterales bacterium]|nr:BatD family protein [Chthoniobacterales bacterium]
MLPNRSTLLSRMIVAALCALVFAGRISAAAPTVTAVLSNSNTAVGQPVQLQIKVTGSSSARPPGQIFVDGLEIRYTGQSQLLEGHNFQFTYSFVYSFTIMPEKAGTFKIPPQMVEAGGSALHTPELILHVADSGSAQSPRSSNRSNAQIDPGKIAFADLTLSKTTAYVGEMIPAILRVGVNIRTPVESLNGAEITGQGFTAQKMRDQKPTVETIDGKTYQVFTFKTALSPARAGKIEIGPVQTTAIVRMPRNPSRNQQMPRDLFDLNDPFMDNFFSDPFFAPSVPQEIRFKSQAVTLEVKALPPGAPADFGGAVGNFTLASEAKPKTAQVGDPFTVTATITGRGNFDRVTAPTLEDESGWHKYPPSSEFKQDDDVGISGTKKFETVLSANERKDKIPAQLFSYFDPAKEQYVTLRAEPIPVRVEGGTAPHPTAAPAQKPAANPAPAAPRAATQQEILHQLTELPVETQSFTPLFARRAFWLAQLIPSLALLGFIAWKIRAAHLNNREALRREQLQHEAAALQRSLRREDVSPEEYFSRASRAVQLKTALLQNVDPNSVDADSAAAAFRMDEATRARLRRLFEKSDEVRYSGGGNGIRLLPEETRNEVQELIDNLRP